MVSVLAIYSVDLSSNLAEMCNFSGTCADKKNENNLREAGVGTFKAYP